MTQDLQQRMNYHPLPGQNQQSMRKVSNRLVSILTKIDVREKVIWDLGCSGGFFSFELAKKAKKVIAIDGDVEIIKRNKAIQEELGVNNIEFIHAELTPELINTLEKADITLFLSVLHHIMSASEAYDWNQDRVDSLIPHLMDNINTSTQEALVFEMGYPNEGYEWCRNLPDFGDNWDDYILTTVFRKHYKKAEIINPEINLNWYNKLIISKLSQSYHEDSILVQRVKGFFKYDPRDFRKLYFGFK